MREETLPCKKFNYRWKSIFEINWLFIGLKENKEQKWEF